MIDRRHPRSRRRGSDRRIADRRLEPRHPSRARIRFLRGGNAVPDVLEGELLDVSAIGVCIRFAAPLEASETLLIEVRDDDGRCFNLSAQVVWIEADDAGGARSFRTGCELRVELSRRQLTLLSRFAAERLAGG